MQPQDRTDRLAASFEARLDRIDADLDRIDADLRNVNERIRRLRAEIASAA